MACTAPDDALTPNATESTAPSPSEFGTTRAAVIDGDHADIANWPGVVGLFFPTGDSETSFGCTGTVIAPRVILTAAHCIALEGAPTEIRLGANNLEAPGTRTIAIADTKALSDGLTGIDIGVLILSEDAPVAPVPLATECGSAREGEPVVLAAYGIATGPDLSDEDVVGVLRKRTLTVDILACNDPILGCPSPGEAPYLVATPAGMCGGDSGGPLFVVNEHGMFVAGVVSGPATTETSDFCPDWQQGLYARPDAVKAWLEQQVGTPLAEPPCDGSPPDAGTADGGPTVTADGGTSTPDGGIAQSLDTESRGCSASNARSTEWPVTVLGLAMLLAYLRRRTPIRKNR